ncbi:MAG: Hsp20/alpha crystallin family protein [Gammaproteobacteria bacterium]|nr:Hsp20/alpha crystallin family protein [Gammaproteobacteria bacterium]
MSLVRYEPYSLLTRLNKLFEPELIPSLWGEESNIATSGWMPSVDIKEENDKFVFLADIPGVDPKDIEVTTENGTLTIKGERKVETEEEREGYKRIERSRGSFYRRFSLPDTADTEKINAKSNNGVLEISVPKTDKVKARKIEIKP